MNSAQEIWNEILRILSGELTPAAMKTWFSGCRPIEWTDQRLTLYVPNYLYEEKLLNRYSEKIKSAMHVLFSADCELTILVGEESLHEYWKAKQAESKTNVQPEML